MPARIESAPPHLLVDMDLSLQILQVADAADLHGLVKANARHLSQSLDWAADFNHNDADREVRRAVEATEAGHEVPYKIMFGGYFAGMARLHSREGSHAQMGYWRAKLIKRGNSYSRPINGLGVASRAAEAIRDFGFYRWDLETIDLHIRPNNERSQRLAERLGARMVGETINDYSGIKRNYTVWRLDHDGR